MSDNKLPQILIVDDKPDDQTALKGAIDLSGLSKCKVLHPREVTIEDLKNAQLVLVDFELEDWTERDDIDILGFRPSDGLALATLFRSHLRSAQLPPTAIAMFSGKLDDMAHPLPTTNRLHTLSNILNLEWVFKKGDDLSENQIIELSKSVLELPEKWKIDSENFRTVNQLKGLLGIESDEDFDFLVSDVEACLPPIHELSDYSHGLVIIRWLLHRILPFPSFLWDVNRLALRLRIDPSDLMKRLEENDQLRSMFEPSSYSGVLSNFSGARWWSSKIEAHLWDLTEGNSDSIDKIWEFINEKTELEIRAKEGLSFPVLCLDSNLNTLPEIYPASECVRIQPDDYPPYADQPWISKELAGENPAMRALVVLDDLDELDS